MKSIIKTRLRLALGLLVFGCGTPRLIESYRGDEQFDAPGPLDLIAPRWITVSRLMVKDRPVYDAFVEVAVKGVRGNDGVTLCELITTHRRFRSDRPWSPLPIALYSSQFESSDGFEDLNDLFRLSLDFDSSLFDAKGMSFRVTFTRGKTFISQWKIYPLLIQENGQEACTAVAKVDKGAQVDCRGASCRIRDITVHVDSWRYITQRSKPPREIDDLSALTLELEDLNSDGTPNGSTYTTRVAEFR